MSHPCFWHGDEPTTENVYRVCLECGHAWPTEAHFVADAAYLGATPPAELTFCPLCTHDF